MDIKINNNAEKEIPRNLLKKRLPEKKAEIYLGGEIGDFEHLSQSKCC